MTITPEILRKLASLSLTPEQMSAVITVLADTLEQSTSPSSSAIRMRRYRERGGDNIPQQLRNEIMMRDKGLCQECNSSDCPQIDHIHPVSKGGITIYDNLQVLCRQCNARKRDRVRKSSKRKSTEIPSESYGQKGSLVPPLNGFPHPSLETSLNPSKLKIPKITLDELSVTHISQWLAEKRHSGKYLDHDPAFILEKFKNYCKAKGRKYTDYVAAYRNAFDWESVQPKQNLQQQRSKLPGGTFL